MPSVSILLPVYNALPDLPRALRSLQAQTWVDFEIIAIDDGSTDGSGELLDSYAKSDARLRVFHQPNAGALGKVLNRAAGLALSPYLARQDADDASAPTRLEAQIRYLEANPQVGVCGTWSWFIDAELGPLFSLEIPNKPRLLTGYLEKGMNPLVHGSTMFRRQVFEKTGGYRGSYIEDLDLWLRMSSLTHLGICPQLGYYFWRSVGGISSGATLKQQALIRLALQLHQERTRLGHESTNWELEYQKIVSLPTREAETTARQTAMHYARGLQLLRRGHFDLAKPEFEKAAIGEGPYAPKARRNLSVAKLAPLLALVYRWLEFREPEHYARRLPDQTRLPAALNLTAETKPFAPSV